MAGPPFTIDTSHPAPTDLVSQFPANETANRQNILDWLTFLADPTTGLLKDSAFIPGQIFPAGSVTNMLFYQATAPTGWVKLTSVNDAALRIVSGTSGGTIAGTAAFSTIMAAARPVTFTALTIAQLPAHSFTFSGVTGVENQTHAHVFSGTTNIDGAHGHSFGAAVPSTTPGGTIFLTTGSANSATISSTAGGDGTHQHAFSGGTSVETAQHTHNFAGSTNTIGTNAGHQHNIDMNILYADIIICTRT